MSINAVTVAQAAKYLGVSEVRVRQLLATGQLQGEKFSSRVWAVDPEALAKFKEIDRPSGNPQWQRKA